MIKVLDKIIFWLNRLLIFVAGVFLVSMVVLTCANIIFRITWVPVKGTFELMGFFGAVLAAFSLGITQVKNENIAVDTVIQLFPQKIKNTLKVINSLGCMFFFVIAAWQIAKWASILVRSGEVTETLRISYYPVAYAVALGSAVLALIFLQEFIKSLLSLRGKKQ